MAKMVPPEILIVARQLVLDAVEHGGELWEHVSPSTVELLVQAVAGDLQDAAELGAELERRADRSAKLIDASEKRKGWSEN